MAESHKALSEAIEMETESVEGIGAAKAEHDLGQPAVSLDLLKEAIEKERAGLDLLEDGVEMLRQALEQRRQALEQQGEILDEIIRTLSTKKEMTQHAKGR